MKIHVNTLYKPFKAEVYNENTLIATLEEEYLSIFRKLLNFTVFRTAFKLNINLYMHLDEKKYIITRKAIWEKNGSKYFLQDTFGTIIYTYKSLNFKDFLRIDLTKTFKIAEIIDFQNNCIATLYTTFGTKKYELIDNYGNKICSFYGERSSKLFLDYKNWDIELYSSDKDYLILSIFITIVICLFKQKR